MCSHERKNGDPGREQFFFRDCTPVLYVRVGAIFDAFMSADERGREGGFRKSRKGGGNMPWELKWQGRRARKNNGMAGNDPQPCGVCYK